MDGLALREHVRMRLAGSLTRWKPLKSGAIGCSFITNLDLQPLNKTKTFALLYLVEFSYSLLFELGNLISNLDPT